MKMIVNDKDFNNFPNEEPLGIAMIKPQDTVFTKQCPKCKSSSFEMRVYYDKTRSTVWKVICKKCRHKFHYEDEDIEDYEDY